MDPLIAHLSEVKWLTIKSQVERAKPRFHNFQWFNWILRRVPEKCLLTPSQDTNLKCRNSTVPIKIRLVSCKVLRCYHSSAKSRKHSKDRHLTYVPNPSSVQSQTQESHRSVLRFCRKGFWVYQGNMDDGSTHLTPYSIAVIISTWRI
jgi:hypothetical protein